jgi:hypothetical protein
VEAAFERAAPGAWERLKAIKPSAPRVLHSASGYVEKRDPLTGDLMPQKVKVSIDGTYRQPDNMKRLRRQAVKDFGIRQIKRAIQKQRRLQQESSNA